MSERWLRPNGAVTVILSILNEGDPVANEERNEDCDNAALVFVLGMTLWDELCHEILDRKFLQIKCLYIVNCMALKSFF